MRMTFYDLDNPSNSYTFKNIGVITCDPSSQKTTTANRVNVLVTEKSLNYFDFFQKNRGKSYFPAQSVDRQSKSYLRSLTVDEIMDGLKPTIVSTIFGENEDSRREFYEKCIVGIKMVSINTEGFERTITQYYGNYDAGNELQAWSALFGRGSVSMSSFTAWRFGVGLWYCETNDLFYVGSCYEHFMNKTSETKNFLYFTEEQAPFIQLYSQQSIGNNKFALATHNYIGTGASTSLAPILDVGFPEYKNESSTFNNWYENVTSQAIRYFLINAIKPIPSKPDYPTPNPQEPDGGDGDFDDGSDPVPIDPLPTVAVGNIVHVYEINVTQQQSLHDFLWSEDFINVFLKSVKQDPFSCLVGLQYMPINPTTAASSVKLGNVDTGVSASLVPNRAYEINFGKVALTEYWGNFLDHNPYTTVELFCPYCTTIQLDTDVVMNTNIGLIYRVDVVSGAILGFITANDNIITTVSGNCATQIPLTVNDRVSAISNSIQSTLTIGSSGAIGGISGVVSSTASAVTSMKSRPEQKGSYAGNTGSLGKQNPYLIIKRPVASIPENFAHNKGFRSNITRKVSLCSGFTKYDSIHIDGVTCTDEERTEIMELLTSGIIA